MNARTGEEGGSDIPERRRKSKDKTKNAEVQKMLRYLESLGLIILNRGLKRDEEGENTYIGARGNTIWDEDTRGKYKQEQDNWMKTGNWTNLKNRVSQATTTRLIEEKDTDSQTWWDEKYWRKKGEVLELF
ncbi:hypothetical protein QAD02_007985 [Eretmocerus hayati]|uniref:Uncharacterized protein n=1 Tax=Eretmocerus hayati TaxID=131215 RepID=A0ACC2N576_9HYME|nr:hypothetical protein QAD02_007985 [Eretmocerus hayati]